MRFSKKLVTDERRKKTIWKRNKTMGKRNKTTEKRNKTTEKKNKTTEKMNKTPKKNYTSQKASDLRGGGSHPLVSAPEWVRSRVSDPSNYKTRSGYKLKRSHIRTRPADLYIEFLKYPIFFYTGWFNRILLEKEQNFILIWALWITGSWSEPLTIDTTNRNRNRKLHLKRHANNRC